MIDWASYFDKIYCIHFLPDSKRIPRLETELSRIGMLQSHVFTYRYTVPSPYDNCILEKCPGSRLPYINLCIETLKILKESMYFGHSRIMIIADDVAFLNDLDEIKSILDDIPEGYGIIQMDKGMHQSEKWMWDKNMTERKLNEHFVASPYHFVYATCNVYTDEGIKDAIDSLENKMIAPDFITKDIGKPTAIAIRNLAIQVLYDNACNLYYGPPEKLLRKYRSYGLDLRDYAVPEGYVGKCLTA